MKNLLSFSFLFILVAIGLSSCEPSAPTPKNQGEIIIGELTQTGGTQGWIENTPTGEVLIFTNRSSGKYLIQNGVSIGTWDVNTVGSELTVYPNGTGFTSVLNGPAGAKVTVSLYSC